MMQDPIEAPERPIDFCPCSRRQRDGHAIVRVVSVEKSQNVKCHRHIFQYMSPIGLVPDLAYLASSRSASLYLDLLHR
jgi:hypothetical protein